jgi:hypothetical protein
LYPISVIRRVIGKNQVCKIFLHLCAECRKIAHEELLRRVEFPENICDTCNDRFLCFTNKGFPPKPNVRFEKGVLQGEETQFYKKKRYRR